MLVGRCVCLRGHVEHSCSLPVHDITKWQLPLSTGLITAPLTVGPAPVGAEPQAFQIASRMLFHLVVLMTS
jgi:hypothetical protein